MRVYISGGITGKEWLQAWSRFRKAQERLEGKDIRVINPMDIADWGLSWPTYMQIAFTILTSGQVDGIYMLKGWYDSHGACLERYYARMSGVPVYYEDPNDRRRFKDD